MLHAIEEAFKQKSYDLAVVDQRVDIGVKLTQAQKNFIADHDTAENYQIESTTSFQAANSFYKVTSPEGKVYWLRENDLRQCNEGLCEVTCKHCPPISFCAHQLKCSCEAYSFSNRCKHLHMINIYRHLRVQQLRNETPIVPSGPRKLTGEMRQHIPVTHMKRKHSPQKQRIPVASCKRPRQSEILKDEDKGAFQLYKTLATSSINDDQWGKTVCRSKDKFTEAIKIMPEKKQTI